GGGGGDGRRQRRREDEGPGSVDQEVAQRGRAGRESTGGPRRLAKRSDQHVGRDAGRGAESASSRADDAEGVRFVDHQDAVGGGRGFGQRREGRGVAVHAEQALRDQG